MALWLDKYRPRSFGQTDYNSALSTRLQILADNKDLPHLLVYGPNGAGKKTRVICILKEIFGPGVEKIKVDSRVFQTPSGRKIDFTMVSSIYHIEITPSDVGNQDGAVIQYLLKEIAQSQQIDVRAKRKFKVVVINQADKLSLDAQSALRRTMEKFSGNIRLIMLATSTCSVISPIRSRTLLIRVPAPTDDEVARVCLSVAKSESVDIDLETANQIARDSNGNLRKALLMLEAMYIQYGDQLNSTATCKPISPDWVLECREIAIKCIGARNSQTILFARAKLYDLIAHCIPSTDILKTVLYEFLRQSELNQKSNKSKTTADINQFQAQLIHSAAHFQHCLTIGSKDIFHLEGFIVKFMYLYEFYL